MQKNEFNEPVPGNGIVEFKAKPNNVKYTEENWNALVLWNFLAEAINGKLKTDIKDKFSKGCIEAVGKRIAETKIERHTYLTKCPNNNNCCNDGRG